MIKRRIKALLGFLIFSLGLYKILLRDRCLIVAFHSVNDDAQNSEISCSSAVFQQYCRFLRKYFSVVPLDEIVHRIDSGESVRGTAAITFDDGYLDNATVAAPILSGLNLPATFFVTTEFIGSSVQAFWDEADGVESKWMSWDDVRGLDRANFDIGCHTRNHANLGQVDLQTADNEITNSRKSLITELGKDPKHFAYPFGGKDDIRPDTLHLVKESGFDCCVSCHGGLADSKSDVFFLPREPVTKWHVSPYHYGFELLFRRPEGLVAPVGLRHRSYP